MYRVVYYHKTTFGMEEACRQLLRRLRDGYGEKYDIPLNGDKLKERFKSDELNTFTDAFVDRIIQHAVDHEGDEDKDKVIRTLACSIQSRRPPKLIKEVQVCEESGRKHHEGTAFFEKCRNNLKNLSEEFRIPLGQFLLCSPSVTIINDSGQYRVSEIASLNADELRSKKHKEEEEQIWIFKDENLEPESFWDLEHSLVKKCAKYFIQSFRLYVVYEGQDKDNVIARLREAVNDWDKG
jgi:HD superfamily phosphohydrolase